MAYQMLRNVPRITQGDELVYFTQSVIKMEKQLFQIAEGQKNNTSVTCTRTSPESISYTTPDRQIGFDGNILTSSELKISRSEQSGKGTESVRCEGNFRERRPAFTSREPIYESAALTQEMPQHTLMPQRHMTESRDSIMWNPSQTSSAREDCKPSGCSITLSRVYFADASKNSDKLHTSKYNYQGNDAEEFENFNLPPNNNTTERQKNWFKDKTITTSARRQSAPSSSSSPLAKPSSILGGMFPTPQPSGGHRKQAHKRSLSETGEYVYFLSESRKPKPFSRDAICPRPRATCNKYFPPEKRSKNEQEEPETIVIPDDDDVKQCANNEAPLMQVITDSEGRIRVNVVNSPTKDRQHVYEATKALEDYHGYLEGNPGELSESKDFLEINECSSEAITFENQIPETCNASSALITNDHHWDAWKKANCVPIDDFDSVNYNMGHCDCRTGQFCGGHRERYIVDENNNICSNVDTPHLNKNIQTPRQCLPDNLEVLSHAELAKQNFTEPQTTQLERCTRVLDFPKDNCPENYQPLFMNGQRWVCMDTQNTHCHKTRVLDGQYIHANAHHSRVSNRQTSGQDSYKNTTQRGSFGTLKGDAECNCGKCEIKSRQETTIMKARRQDPKLTRKKNVQPSCSTPKNKGAKDNSDETLPPQTIKGKESSGSDFREAQAKSTAEDSNVSKETQNTSLEMEVKSRYQCDWPACDKSFRHYSFLVLHKRIHTGERPYVCSWQGCSKQFRRSDDYQRHYRVHTGVKPYACLLCGKKFKRSDHRLFHYRAIHHVENRGQAKKKKVQ